MGGGRFIHSAKMNGLTTVLCISLLCGSVCLLSDSEEKASKKAMVSKFLQDNHKSMRGKHGAGGDEFLRSVLQSQFGSSSTQLADSSSSLFSLSDTVGTAPCASGWTPYSENGMCYKVSKYDVDWYSGEEYCWNQRAGAHLASIHSEAESRWLNAQFRNKKGNYMDAWIGLRRDCDNVTYIWTDGTPADFLWWQPGYPMSEYAEYSCVTLWEEDYCFLEVDYVPGQYDDMRLCSEQAGSVALCKYDPNTSIIGEKYIKKTCSLIPDPTKPPTTTITSTTTTPTTTTVTTTTTVPTTTITTTEPTTTTVPTTTAPTITTITINPGTTSTPTTTGITSPRTTTYNKDCSRECDKFWTSYNGECYGIVKGTANFATAAKGCQLFGGEMAVITDFNMNEAMRMAFSTNNDSTIMNQAWIGDSSSYANWAPGKPNQAQGTNYTKYCNVMTLSVVNSGSDLGTYSRGVWMDYPCSLKQEYVICKQIQ